MIKEGDVVHILGKAETGIVVGRGHFGWKIRVGEWVRYPVQHSELKLVEPETRLSWESEPDYALRIAKHYGA